jgi:hypothetical protein
MSKDFLDAFFPNFLSFLVIHFVLFLTSKEKLFELLGQTNFFLRIERFFSGDKSEELVTVSEKNLAELKETLHVPSTFDHDVCFGGFVVFILTNFECLFQRVIKFLDILIKLR